MWAPADVFTKPINMITLPLRRVVTYFYEHTVVLALVLLVTAAIITVMEVRSR